MIAAVKLGIPAATASKGLTIFKWGSRAASLLKKAPSQPVPVAREPEGLKVNWGSVVEKAEEEVKKVVTTTQGGANWLNLK